VGWLGWEVLRGRRLDTRVLEFNHLDTEDGAEWKDETNLVHLLVGVDEVSMLAVL